jgi:broad specificity phosphatase PhoE
MRCLYLFRHGETDFNREQRFQGHLDVPLNDEGRRQAASLVRPLGRIGLECILSSDLRRARETAEIVARGLEIPVFETAGLREAHLGTAQGLTVEQIEAQFGRELVEKWRSPYLSDADVSYPGGESGREVLERVLASMEKFLGSTDYQHIGVATHGGVIRRVVRALLADHSAFIPIPNGIVYPLEHSLERAPLKLLNSSPLRRP